MFSSLLEKYPEYTLEEKPDSRLIAEYEGALPNPILDLWADYGFGNYMDGYLKVVNPKDYQTTLYDSYIPTYDDPIVVFATGMSDLLVWENNYLVQINYRHKTSKVIESGFRYFLEDLSDSEFLEDDLLWEPFEEAKKRLGVLAYDECYGYEPVLAAGGSEKVENIRKVRIQEHILINTQLAGKVE